VDHIKGSAIEDMEHDASFWFLGQSKILFAARKLELIEVNRDRRVNLGTGLVSLGI
jgi:hypothetical protein